MKHVTVVDGVVMTRGFYRDLHVSDSEPQESPADDSARKLSPPA